MGYILASILIDEEAEAQKGSHLGKFSRDGLYGHF